MDNFKLDVVSEGEATFKLALDIALAHGRSASHYAVIEHDAAVNEWNNKTKKRKTLLLFWHDDEGFKPKPTPFPCEMKGKALISFVWNWLEDAWEKRAHGDEPGHDGSNGNGWRIFNEDWGYVADSHYAFVGIQPVWAMYGK